MSVTLALIGAYFDARFYLEQYPDVKAAGVDPLTHFVETGSNENRDPTSWFSTAAHRAAQCINEDENPFVRFLVSNREKADELKALASVQASLDAATRPPPLVQPFFSLRQQSSRHEVVVFTSVFGLRHLLPSNTTQHADQRLYADVPIKSVAWSFHPAMYWDADPKLGILFHKYCMPCFFPEGTKLVWVDSRVSLQIHVIDAIAASLDRADLCLFRHYERTCVYEELEAIIRGRRATLDECCDFERVLTETGFPNCAGLYETGALGIRVSERSRRALRRVFGLCKRHIPRDQVTLPLALREFGLDVTLYNEGRTHLRNSPGVFVQAW